MPRAYGHILDIYHYYAKCFTSVAGSSFDLSYRKLDSKNYYDILRENDIATQLLNIPKYFENRRLDYLINLYVKPFIGVKLECKPQIFQIINKDITQFNGELRGVSNIAQESVWLSNVTFVLAIVTTSLALLLIGIT